MHKTLLLTALVCAAVRAETVDGARLPFFPVLPAADIHVLPPEAGNSPRRLVPEDLLRHVNNLEIIAADTPVAAAQMDERHGTVIVAGQRQWLRQIAALPPDIATLPMTPLREKLSLTRNRHQLRLRPVPGWPLHRRACAHHAPLRQALAGD